MKAKTVFVERARSDILAQKVITPIAILGALVVAVREALRFFGLL